MIESQVMPLCTHYLPLKILDHQKEGIHVDTYVSQNLVTYLLS